MRRISLLFLVSSLALFACVAPATASLWDWSAPVMRAHPGDVTAAATGPGGGPPPPGGTGTVTDPDGDISRATAFDPTPYWPSAWTRTDTLDQANNDIRDVYSLSVTAGDYIVIRLDPSTPLTDFDLVVFAPGSTSVTDTPVDWSWQAGNMDEEIKFSPAMLGLGAGTYYIEVRSKMTSPAGNYTLRVIRNVSADVGAPTVGFPIDHNNEGARVDASDDPSHVYPVYVATGDVVYVRLTQPSYTDFDIHVFGPGTSTFFGSETYAAHSERTGNTDWIAFSANKLGGGAGIYYIDVYAESGSGLYQLTAYYDAGGDIPGVGTVSGLDWSVSDSTNAVYDKSDIWRTIPLSVGQVVLSQTSGGEHAQGIWDPSCTNIWDQYSWESGNQLAYWVKSPGVHYLGVCEQVTKVGGAYQLKTRILPVDTDFGPPGRPVSLPYSGTGHLQWDQNVSDMYRIHLNAGDEVSAWTSSADAGADFNLYVYPADPDATWYLYSPLGGAAHLMEFTASATGDYYVQVCDDMALEYDAVWDFSTRRSCDYSLGIRKTAAAQVPTSLTIKTSATSVTRPKPFILQGLFNGGSPGDLVIVWVKKPGKRYFSYSSNRIAFAGAGGTNWWYRYTPLAKTCPAGTYYFKCSYPGSAGKAACTSPVITVRIR